MRLADGSRLLVRLAQGQGLYFVAAGLWPILHLKSFERVTGPKFDDWLVKAMGGLIATVGATLLVGSRRASSIEMKVLAMGSSAVLGSSAGWFAARGRIAPVYLLDAATEAALVGAWAVLSRAEAARSEGSVDESAEPTIH